MCWKILFNIYIYIYILKNIFIYKVLVYSTRFQASSINQTLEIYKISNGALSNKTWYLQKFLICFIMISIQCNSFSSTNWYSHVNNGNFISLFSKNTCKNQISVINEYTTETYKSLYKKYTTLIRKSKITHIFIDVLD